MTLLWNKFKNSIIDSLNVAIDKTEELTSVGKIKLEIMQCEHRLDEKHAELGKYVFGKISDKTEKMQIDSKIKEIRKEITQLQSDLDKKESELGRIKEKEGIDFDS